jgi:hypothetical protein
MAIIKKFNESLEESNILDKNSIGEWGLGRYSKAHFLSDKLNAGYAIGLLGSDIDRFFDILKDMSWIKIGTSEHFNKDNKYYFVLFGDRLLHSDKPYFGGNELKVYNI